ncbi:DNA-binding HxlR family transcriptional regulator [Paraburkholderia sp. MM5384-R2]|nr:DNA-binding HxlR family transcriptional regulator [Paraburkholderia sp. MM5384-R2]
MTEAMRRGELHTADCPSREVFKHVTSLWGVLCLIALRDGTLRFSELRRKATGVSERMLALTLQRLEQDGFVRRTAHPVIPPHVEYALTPLGRQASGHVATLADWVEANLGQVMEARRKTSSS